MQSPFMMLVAFGAGLATGLLHFTVPTLAGLAPIVVLGWRRWPGAAVWAGVMLLGALSGGLAFENGRESCGHRLPEGRLELAVIAEESADSGGGLTTVRPVSAGCRGAVRARWIRDRRVEAGTRYDVRARWFPAREGFKAGILIVDQADSTGVSRGIRNRLRNRILVSTGALYGSRAPLVDALILNRRASLDPEISEAYARSGLVHILSISGFHVGLIAGWFYLFARLLGLGRTGAGLTSAGLSSLYVAFIGWPAPATRAAALVVLVAYCRWRQRQVHPDALLSVTCLAVLLLNPGAVFELGAWLSAAALWGATRFSRWSDRALGSGHGWRMLASSVGATLATAPLTAAILGSVALVGIGLNFVAIPLAALAVPGVLASVLLHPVLPGLAEALAGGAGAGLALLDQVALLGSRVPGGHVILPVDPRSGLPWLALLAFTVWSLGRANRVWVVARRWAAGLAILAWGAVGLAFTASARDTGSDLTLHFLPVGQGDGAAIRTPGGHWVLLDGGPSGGGGDAGRRVVVPFLRRQGVRRLAAVVVSHAHADHLGGVPAVLEQFPSDIVMEPGDLTSDPGYLGFLELLEAREFRWHPGRRGEGFTLDSVRFTILHPDTTWSEWGLDLNEDSVVLLVEYRDFTALFSGDAGIRAEPRFAAGLGPVDLLKVGHHGSRTATGDPLLDRIRPRAAVISVGRNTYGHPAPETLARLARHQVPVWRTDQDGAVRVHTDGATMTICAARGCQRLAVAP